jgi:2-oxoglutarate decarboxylase
MALKSDSELGINSWLEDEIYRQYLRDRSAVDESWKDRFESNGVTPAVTPASPAAPGRPAAPRASDPAAGVELQPLRGAAGRIAENMSASLAIPLAASQRTIAVKVMDENRRIINQHRTLIGRGKVSYTHLIGWAIVKALAEMPALNHAYAEKDGQPFRVARPQVNLGIAVDVTAKDGSRGLMVPNIKNAGGIDFQEYVTAFDDLVSRARSARLTAADFQGTSISLTNPGTVGTMASSPRLMLGQGAIIAVGAIDYPAEYQGAAAETRALLGISKVMTLTCTYDHRIIQGAESGLFLGRLQALLDGRDGFYEEIFSHLRMPHQPVRWETDRKPLLPGMTGARTAEIAKEAGIIQMINAYRVRGHLIADLDPLGAEPSYHPELDPETYGLTIWDLDREFLTGSLGEADDPAEAAGGPIPVATLRQILETLRQTYCGKIGCEYMNIQVPEQKRCRSRSAGSSGAWSRRPTTGRWPRRRAAAFCAISSPPRSSSTSCIPVSWVRSASPWRAGKQPWRSSRRSWSAPRPTRCMRS